MASDESHDDLTLLSDAELDALRPIEEAVESLLDQSMGLAQFVEELEEIRGDESEPPPPQVSEQLDDADLRLVERFSPPSEARL